jgi:hypothetical protein
MPMLRRTRPWTTGSVTGLSSEQCSEKIPRFFLFFLVNRIGLADDCGFQKT